MSNELIGSMMRMRWVLFAMLVFAATPAAVSAKDGESKFATLNGAKIHYQSFGGSGNQAFVLVHGWSCDLGHWRYQIPDLAKRARVIAIDLPGHGQSDKPDIAYTIDHFAVAIDAVLRDAKVDKAVVLGHSMGTPIARQFYRKYPQKTLAIVIVDGALRPFGDKAMRDQYVTMFKGADFREVGLRMFDTMTPALSADDKKVVKASMSNTPQNVMVSAMEGMNNESLYGPDKISVPVLAILAKSPFWAPDTEQFLRSLAPDLEFVMWEGVDHFLHLEKRKEFNDAVVAFVNRKNLLK
jgi:pimeloyl-ACP methyl ester carboxylesterase